MSNTVVNEYHAKVLGLPPSGDATHWGPEDADAPHRVPDGLGIDGQVRVYRDAAANNEHYTDDLGVAVAVGLRSSLIASSSAIANTAAATLFNKSVSIGANTITAPGMLIRVTAAGRYSTKASAPGTVTLNLSLLFGGPAVVLLSATSGTVPTGLVNAGWSIVGHLVVRAVGASGAGVPMPGIVELGGLAPLAAMPPVTGPSTVNYTVSAAIFPQWQWSVADVANSAVLDVLTLEILRPAATVA